MNRPTDQAGGGNPDANTRKRGREEEEKEVLGNYQASRTTHLEDEFVKSTIGLVSANEYRAKRQALETKVKNAMTRRLEEEEAKDIKPLPSPSHLQVPAAAIPVSKPKKPKLSFASCDSDDSDSDSVQFPSSSASDVLSSFSIVKDDSIDTRHLPDKMRAEALKGLHSELTEDFYKKKNATMDMSITVTFSYWDGAGHRDKVVMKQRNTMFEFLQAARERLISTNMPQVKRIRVENMMFIKEDVIMPNDLTFYDLIDREAWGQSGPLYDFDVYDDLRLNADVTTKGKACHPGKIVTRSWYELNKHTFPASKWIAFDPVKAFRKGL